MAESTCNIAVRRIVWIARLVGVGIYILAFFLPAVREVATPGGDPPDALQGSRCAWVTLVNTFNPEMWRSKDFLAVLSGWINPLLVVYLIFLIFPSFVWPRRIAAGAMLAFLAGTWIFFDLYPLVPLLGHWLWAGGIVLIVAGEFVCRKCVDSAAD
ncbi:MAG: hypothetical protein ABR907_10570 [Terracidiphilus sp.]